MLFSTWTCTPPMHTIPQYNATPECDREKLDGALTRALLHAKVRHVAPVSLSLSSLSSSIPLFLYSHSSGPLAVWLAGPVALPLSLSLFSPVPLYHYACSICCVSISIHSSRQASIQPALAPPLSPPQALRLPPLVASPTPLYLTSHRPGWNSPSSASAADPTRRVCAACSWENTTDCTITVCFILNPNQLTVEH